MNIKKIFSRGFWQNYLTNKPKPVIQIHDPITKRIPTVDKKRALQEGTFFRCLNFISTSISSLPLDVFRKTDRIDYLSDVFSLKANPFHTFSDIISLAIKDLYLFGNSYIKPIFDNGELVQLDYLPPSSVSLNKETLEYTLEFRDHTKAIFQPDEIIHIKGFSENGLEGESIIKFMTPILQQSYFSNLLGSEDLDPALSKRRFLVTTEEDTFRDKSEPTSSFINEAAKDLERQLDQGRLAIYLSDKVKVDDIDLDSNHEKLNSFRNWSSREICRFFGVPPELVFVQNTSNYEASKNLYATFVSQTIAPLCKKIEDEFMKKILTSRERKRGITFKFNLSNLNSNATERMEIIEKSIRAGVLTINEAREMENRPPVPGGDTVFITQNVAEVNENGKVE